MGVGSVEPSWGSESRLTQNKRVISPSARKHYYKEDSDDELESGAAGDELEERN